MDESMGLIDVSREDDCLIDSPSAPEESSNQHEYFEFLDVGNDEVYSRENVQAPLFETKLFESPEKTTKTGKCNLRKSLAWDSAFFTSAGVLDAEELSFVNNGLKSSRSPLPVIQEDLRRSEESSSTLDSDNVNLQSLEGDLFEDIRASMQMFTEASDAAKGRLKGSRETVQSIQPLRKVAPASRDRKMVKPLVTSKTHNTTPIPDRVKRGAALVHPKTLQVPVRSGVSVTSLLKPPKTVAKVHPTPAVLTKSSIGVNRIKTESNNAKVTTGSIEHMVVSRRPGSADSLISSKSTPSPKSSSSSNSPFTLKNVTAAWSSHNRSDSNSSDSTGRSPPIKSGRSKPFSRNIGSLSASVSTLKTPSSLIIRNKIQPMNSRTSAYLISSSKPILSLSPISSVDSRSSVSSSASIIQRSGNSLTVPDISTPRKAFSYKRDASPAENKGPGIRLPTGSGLRIKRASSGSGAVSRPQSSNGPNQLIKKASLGSGTVTRLATTSSPSLSSRKTSLGSAVVSTPASTNISKFSKPSGLRLPSPKIGFFDVEKSLPSTPDSDMQFHPGAGSGLPGNGVAISKINEGATNKAEASKYQAARPVNRTHISLDPNQKSAGSSREMSQSFSTRENNIAFSDSPQRLRKLTSDRNLDNNIILSKSAEKENVITSSENQVENLVRLIGNVDLNVEEPNEKKNSSLSQFEHIDAKLPISQTPNSVHNLKEDFERTLTKPPPLSISPGIMDTVPNMRTPLAVRETFPPEGIQQTNND